MANNLPRFLPLVFVAVAGVLAMKVITSADILPDLFHKAEAFAADSKGGQGKAGPAKADKPAKAAAATAGEPNKSDDPTEAYSSDPALQATTADASASDAAATAPVTPICATSIDQLAQQAGMSPNELQILQSLGTRRAELDQREAQLDAREPQIQAAEEKLDTRIAALTTLKTQIQALLDQASKTSDADTTRLVSVYSAMKPKDAAAILTTMTDDVRLPIAAGMKDRVLAGILGAMEPAAAKELTEKLANRMKAANGLQDQLNKLASNSSSSSASSSSSSSSAAPALASATPAKPATGPGTYRRPHAEHKLAAAKPAPKAGAAAPATANASAATPPAPAATPAAPVPYNPKS